MHCSLWRFEGDPEDLERRYLAMLAEIPESNHTLHAAARTPTGLLIFDTCPSEQVFRDFVAGRVRELLEQHGLTPAGVDDYPVTAAYAQGARIDSG